MRSAQISGLVLLCLTSGIVIAAQTEPRARPDTKRVKIARALSAAPASIAKDAKIIDRDEKGNETVLRDGANGFTCFPGHPGVVGDTAFCANGPALQW